MKKKIISVALAVVLVFSLSVTSFAAGGLKKPALSAGATSQTGAPTQVRALLSTVLTNRATLLTVEANNITLAGELKTLLTSIKSGDGTLSQDTLNQLKALKDQLKALHEQLAATKGQLNSLMTTYKQYKEARDFENAAAVLQQVIAVQQDRITTKTAIGSLTQQMIDILGSATISSTGTSNSDTPSTGTTDTTDGESSPL